MSKCKVQLAIVGHPPPDFDARELASWNSNVFEISSVIESFQLNEDAAGDDWEFSDVQFENAVRRDPTCDFLVMFVTVKLECNWYLRRLSDNRIVFTFYEMDHIVRHHRLPLKNLSLRVLYAAVLVFRRYGSRIPVASESTNYAHDETRGCLFDMNANKMDVVASLHRPCVCERCCSQLKEAKVSNELIESVKKEIRKVQKPLADRIIDFVRAHTIFSIFVSVLSALVLGITASLIAAWVYEFMKATLSSFLQA
ncbi:hypothetical protein ABB27_13960 [Stenotrophomonas terrae]|uniref:Uncharacterized protein n=1 Tax=Stenotrophomonas terrae TaxID=405446 RepID=A0A0R0CJD8_9GAMM|nr:hypothetical protein [Stenotrophomonas terrae]KRG66354.1 hypothetical protein ABB27_13960 [Stenotrophomonas terrae]